MERSGFGTIRRERSGRYQARVRVRGRQFGIGTFNTRREAAQALGRFAASYETPTPLDPKAGRETIGEFAQSWWKTRTGNRPSTQLRDREALGRDVLPFFRDAQLGRLDRANVRQWIEKLSQRLAPSTVRCTYIVLNQLLGVAVERGMIALSPAKGVQLPRIVRTAACFLTPGELEQLAMAMEPRYRAMVLVMAWATLRIGEATGLRRSDVNFDAGTAHIENTRCRYSDDRSRGHQRRKRDGAR
jgi:hypothetical protein